MSRGKRDKFQGDIWFQRKVEDRMRKTLKLLQAQGKMRKATLEGLRDKPWAAEHANDSDEQLLDYLRRCAAELGHTPMRREVPGGTYISERFGNWTVALTVAELRLPRSIKPPKETAIRAYLKRKQQAEIQK